MQNHYKKVKRAKNCGNVKLEDLASHNLNEHKETDIVK